MSKFFNLMFMSIALIIVVVLAGAGFSFASLNIAEDVYNIRSWFIPLLLLGIAVTMVTSFLNGQKIKK